MIPILDIELLRTFHAVARLGRFRIAAEYVHKSPAAVSVHIQRLEAVAGGRLLERDNQSVTLTVLGERLLSSTTALLQSHDRVVEELHGTALAGRVVFGIPDEYAAHVICDILPAFTSTWPNVVLEVKTAPSFELREQVEQGKLDLALVVQPMSGRTSALLITVTTPVWVGSTIFAAQEGEPLPLALYAEPCPYRAAMTDTLGRAGRRWRIVLDSASSQAIKACVESGLGVTLVDRARVSQRMKVLSDLPTVGDHEVVLMHARGGQVHEAIDLLSRTILENFRL